MSSDYEFNAQVVYALLYPGMPFDFRGCRLLLCCSARSGSALQCCELQVDINATCSMHNCESFPTAENEQRHAATISDTPNFIDFIFKHK